MNALYTTLTSDSILVNSGVPIGLYEIINTIPMQYWVNVQQPTITGEARRANIHQPWMADYNFSIIAQVEDYANIEQRFQSIQDLNGLTQAIISAVNCNRTLNDTVNIITGGWNIAPFDRDDIQSDVFIMNEITFTAEVFA